MPSGDQIMWQAIREALKALTNILSRTTAAFGAAFWETGSWAVHYWNHWARVVSGTSYRPAPVTEVQDSVEEIVERAPEPSPAVDDLAARGALVRSAAASILCGDRDAGQDLPSGVRLWLLALEKPDLRTLLAATDTQIGRHASGQSCVKGAGNRPVSLPDAERDLMLISRREESLRRGISMHERARIEELLAVASTRGVAETEASYEAVTTPRMAF